MKTRRILALITAMLICFTLLPSYTLAASAVTFTAIDGKAGNSGENYEKLFDGKKSSGKYCVGVGDIYVVARATEQVIVKGYTFTTGNDNASYHGRNPKDWVLCGSNDYNESTKTGTWTQIHKVDGDQTMKDLNYTSYSFACADNATAYKYYKFEFTANHGDSVMQLCEIEFNYSVPPTPWQTNFKAINGKMPNNTSEGYTNLFDDKKISGNFTKYCIDWTDDIFVVAEADEKALVTGYTFTTGNDNASWKNRNPKSWKLYGCNDYNNSTSTGSWELLHTVTDDATMKDENFTPYSFAFSNETPYKYYKFEFTAYHDGGVMQLCEIEFTHTTNFHNWKVIETNEPTCTKSGYTKRECTDCGDEQTVELPPIDHNWTELSRTAPTCEGEGKIVYKCSMCNGTKETVLASLGHKWKETSNEPSTCITKGTSHQKCETCQATQDVELPLIDHSWVETSKVEAKCTESGELTEQCDMCQAERKTPIKPLGHEQGENGLCGRCHEKVIKVVDDSAGNTAYYYDMHSAVNAATYGDTIVLLQDVTIEKELTISKTNAIVIDLNGHTLTQLGDCRVIYVGTSLTLKDTSANRTGKICGGKATGIGVDLDGGGVYVSEYATFTMDGATISDCKANGYGGGIFVSRYAFLNMSDGAKIEKCTAQEGGGIKNRGTADIKNSTVSECQAEVYGGGIYTQAANDGGLGKLNLENSTIEDCKVTAETSKWPKGGGICIFRATEVTIKGTSVTRNASSCDGGGIGLFGGNLTLENCNIEYNSASNFGGGIHESINAYYNSKVNSTLTINGGRISDNEASNGAGIYVPANNTLNLNNATVSGNTASSNGGGIYVEGAITACGAPQVNGNVVRRSGETEGESEGTPSNIYLLKGKTISITGDGIKEYLSETGYITPELCVTAQSGAATITDSWTEDCSKYFKSDNADYAVFFEDSVVKLAKGVKITFEYAEGDTRIETVISDKAVAEPEAVAYKDGYTFVGWLLNGKDYDFSKPVTADITLTPKWVQNGKTTLSVNYTKFYVIDIKQNAKIYIASYKNDTIIDAKTVDVNDVGNNSAYAYNFIYKIADTKLNTADADRIAVFLWDEEINPLCDKAVIEFK